MQFTKITNKQVKFLQSLKQKKYRQKYNKYTIEGEKIVTEIVSEQPKYIDYLVSTEDYAETHYDFMTTVDAQVLIASSKHMEMMSSMKSAPALIALGNVNEDLELRAFAQNGRYLFLEHAQDPGNMGTMIRTAAWFGMDGVLIGEGSTEWWNQKVIQSSMGAVFKMKHKVIARKDLESCGLPIIVTSLQGENLKNFKWPTSYVICLGNEGKGITNELADMSTHNVFIESNNNKGAESLNVASSAAIILYEAQISSQ